MREEVRDIGKIGPSGADDALEWDSGGHVGRLVLYAQFDGPEARPPNRIPTQTIVSRRVSPKANVFKDR